MCLPLPLPLYSARAAAGARCPRVVPLAGAGWGWAARGGVRASSVLGAGGEGAAVCSASWTARMRANCCCPPGCGVGADAILRSHNYIPYVLLPCAFRIRHCCRRCTIVHMRDCSQQITAAAWLPRAPSSQFAGLQPPGPPDRARSTSDRARAPTAPRRRVHARGQACVTRRNRGMPVRRRTMRTCRTLCCRGSYV